MAPSPRDQISQGMHVRRALGGLKWVHIDELNLPKEIKKSIEIAGGGIGSRGDTAVGQPY